MIQWQFIANSSIFLFVVVNKHLDLSSGLKFDFSEIQPYSQEAFRQGLARLIQSPFLPSLIQALYPSQPPQYFHQSLQTIQNVEEFQSKIISGAVNAILSQTTKGLTLSGLTHHPSYQKYLYISNHRDIICDPAFLTNSLFLHGYGSPQICLGDNLLTHPLIVDLVKMNKGITVKRNLAPRELLQFSSALSHYIYGQIHQKQDSIWIAQREGRAKDGNDKTQNGILKMLTMAGEGEFLQRVKHLNVIPVSISYEYDPCDALKARELYLTELNGSYQKKSDEDMMSIRTGIEGFKGRVHIHIGTPLNQLIEEKIKPSQGLSANLNKREQVTAIAQLLDQEIQQNFHNWPTHWIAYDLISNHSSAHEHYTENEKRHFLERMETQLKSLSFPPEALPRLRDYFLMGYSNSVKNQLQHV